MGSQIYQILGKVVRHKGHQAIADIRVEAWDNDLLVDDLVGSAVTDASGAFQIRFDESYFTELFLDCRPDLFFKVIKSGKTEIVIEVELPATNQSAVGACEGGDQQRPGNVSGRGQGHQSGSGWVWPVASLARGHHSHRRRGIVQKLSSGNAGAGSVHRWISLLQKHLAT